MIARIHRSDASANLIETYHRIGTAIPGVKTETRGGYRLCLGPFPHPVCNFAADLDLTRFVAKELAEIAAARSNFNVYLLPGDEPDNAASLLHHAGFRQTYRLIQMIGCPRQSRSHDELYRAESPISRARIAQFMSEQFFSKQTSSFRARLTEATVRAAGLELYCIAEQNHIRAGMMLFRQDGILGVYNLCVDKSHRGRGLGTRLVRWATETAASTQSRITLQCDPKLEVWYRRMGFDESGVVEVFSLAKPGLNDIMYVE